MRLAMQRYFCLACWLLAWNAGAQAQSPALDLPVQSPTSTFDSRVLLANNASPIERRLAARRLVAEEGAVRDAEISGILRSDNQKPAKLALLQAFADSGPARWSAHVEDVLWLIRSSDAEVRRLAGAALAAGLNGARLEGLAAVVADARESLETRICAAEALAASGQRPAVVQLVRLLDADLPESLRAAIVGAFEPLADMRFDGSEAALRDWWRSAAGLSDEGWRDLQIKSLQRQNRLAHWTASELEQRLKAAIRDSFFRTPEEQREAALMGLLGDPQPAVRLVALELARIGLVDGRKLSDELMGRVRGQLADRDPAIRAAAVAAVAALRDPADEERFLTSLSREDRSEVIVALANGLGYVGTEQAALPLMDLAGSASPHVLSEAVSALGRLAERGVLPRDQHSAIAAALSDVFGSTPRRQTAVRESVVRAMARLADARLTPELIAALDPLETAPIRQAAARGLALLADPNHIAARPSASAAAGQTASAAAFDVESLVAFAGDPDDQVRRSIIEALAVAGQDDAALEALVSRLGAREPDAAIRDTAWRGVLRVLGGAPAEQIEQWVVRLREMDADGGPRRVALLQLAERAAEQSGDSQRAAVIRTRIAQERIGLGQPVEAIADLEAALAVFHQQRSPRTAATALQLLRTALQAGQYDAALAEKIRTALRSVGTVAPWNTIETTLSGLLKPDSVDRAVASAEALAQWAPCDWEPDDRAALAGYMERAYSLRSQVDREQVAAAVTKLRLNSTDDAARTALLRMGPRAVIGLRAELASAVSADPPNPELERLLYELLRQIAPAWPGYDPAANSAEKLKRIEEVSV